jgi:prepilin-type N-terminal cleavage/methylation domain-containing protein
MIPIRSQKARSPLDASHRRRGFTLPELLVSSLVLLIVTGAVFEQIAHMQKRSNAESLKTDMSRQAREFADQTVRDLHAAGYPPASMYGNLPDNTDSRVAAGLVSVSPTQILMEGAINGDGIVYSVTIAYVPSDPNDPACPCLRRMAAPKIPGSPWAQNSTTVYTEAGNVLPPGTGAGRSGQDLFAFYDRNGNQVDVSNATDISTAAGEAKIATIKTVQINVSLQADLRGVGSSGLAGTSISALARIGQQ